MDFFSSSFFLLLPLLLHLTFSSPTLDTLTQGSSLSVDKSSQNILTSQNRVFSAGFFPIGENAFSFAVWIVKSSPPTLVWIANRDNPVNGVASKLTLSKNGNLVLKDGPHRIIWDTTTTTTTKKKKSSEFSPVVLKLRNDGNLVVVDTLGVSLWESFDSPTDTLLPRQMLTKHVCLVSSRTKTNYSSGNYKLYFDTNNVLSLLYNVPETTTIYWPPSWNLPWKFGRSTYNNSRIAVLDRFGNFTSSDDFAVTSADYGTKVLRRLTLDTDGNLRLYSLNEARMSWVVSWQAISQPCLVHGVCGPYGVCSYDRIHGRGCDCLPGYRVKDPGDWTKGCEPEMEFTCNASNVGFLEIKKTDFYGYDKGGFQNATFKECEKTCLDMCSCKAFQLSFTTKYGYLCYPKTSLLNGYTSPTFNGSLYVKYPKPLRRSVRKRVEVLRLVCPKDASQVLNTRYEKTKRNESLDFLVWFAISVAGLETTCFVLIWFFLFRTDDVNTKVVPQGYAHAPTGFTKYTYAQLKLATNGFCDEIGRGSGGIVYKATLPDRRIAAVKRLHEGGQEEVDFQTEASVIGRLNHMNLIQLWGYCAERNNRLLVYEYVEHGSLADNLTCNALNREKMFDIAIGTAKGLAYLHEECLEWILHCDIKPQNILLDSDYQPKVADFGLSKLLNRGGGLNTLSFSRIRGTRGYMAPEWVYNQPISSKVDVYSYGIVVLEMVSGKNPNHVHSVEGLMMGHESNVVEMERLVKVGLKCVVEDKDLRPTMSQVVEMLQGNDVVV